MADSPMLNTAELAAQLTEAELAEASNE